MKKKKEKEEKEKKEEEEGRRKREEEEKEEEEEEKEEKEKEEEDVFSEELRVSDIIIVWATSGEGSLFAIEDYNWPAIVVSRMYVDFLLTSIIIEENPTK